MGGMSRLPIIMVIATLLPACVDLEPTLDDAAAELVRSPSWIPDLDLPELPEVPGDGGDSPEFDITQQDGLQRCFYQLEVDVRGCHYAFPTNVADHNACIEGASADYDSCLRWVQTLPYEEDAS